MVGTILATKSSCGSQTMGRGEALVSNEYQNGKISNTNQSGDYNSNSDKETCSNLAIFRPWDIHETSLCYIPSRPQSKHRLHKYFTNASYKLL